MERPRAERAPKKIFAGTRYSAVARGTGGTRVVFWKFPARSYIPKLVLDQDGEAAREARAEKNAHM